MSHDTLRKNAALAPQFSSSAQGSFAQTQKILKHSSSEYYGRLPEIKMLKLNSQQAPLAGVDTAMMTPVYSTMSTRANSFKKAHMGSGSHPMTRQSSRTIFKGTQGSSEM